MPFSLICKSRRQQHSPLVPTPFQFNPQQHLRELQVRQYFLGPNLCLEDPGSGLSFTEFNSRSVYKISYRIWLVELHLPGSTFYASCPHHLVTGVPAVRRAGAHMPSPSHPVETCCETSSPAASGAQHGPRGTATHCCTGMWSLPVTHPLLGRTGTAQLVTATCI